MENKRKKKVWLTGNLKLAAVLHSKRIPLIKIIPNRNRPGKVKFVFKYCNQIESLLKRYANGQLMVNYAKIVHSERQIFDYMAECNQNTLVIKKNLNEDKKIEKNTS